MPRLCFDREISVHELQALAHADEAKPSTCRLGCGEVEPLSRVGNHEMNIVPRPPQFHVEMFDVAVFRRIVERGQDGRQRPIFGIANAAEDLDDLG